MTNLKHMSTQVSRRFRLGSLVACSALALSMSACEKTGDSSNSPDGGGAAGAGKSKSSTGGGTMQNPTEKAMKSFTKQIEAYDKAMADGKLSPGECSKLASGFKSVHSKYGKQMSAAAFNAGVVHQECGDEKAAEAIYQSLAKEGFHIAINNLGVIHWERGQRTKALDYFEKSVDADRVKAFAARNNLAAAHRDKYTVAANSKDFEVAEKQLQNVLAVDSSNKMAYENLARLYYDRGRLKDPSYLLLANLVIGQAQKLLDTKGEKSAALRNIRGLLFMVEDNQVDALRQFGRAVEIEPKNPDANLNIAFISLRFRDFQTAEKSLAVALDHESQKNNVEAYLAMGVAKRGLKKYKEAQKFFEKATKVAAKDPRAHFNLGVLAQEHLISEDGVDQAKIEALFGRAKSHFKMFLTVAGSKAEWKDLKEEARLRMLHIDEAIDSFRVAEELAKKAKAMEEAARKADEEERKRLLELEAKAEASMAGDSAEPAAEEPKKDEKAGGKTPKKK